jgi:hypothetical protein
MEKNYCNLHCFQEKNYKVKFTTSLILKNKINKDNFEKNHKKKGKKTMQGNIVTI